MRRPSDVSRVASGRRSPLLAAAFVLAACASPGPMPSPEVDPGAGGGFTITESTRVGPSARSDFSAALQLLEAERYVEAIDLLRRVTEDAPDATAAHIDLAMAYARIGDLEKAEASLHRALANNPRHPVAYNELGMLYRRTGRFREARASYEKALALYPGFHFAHRNLAILCDLYLGDPACALEHYEAYTRAVPGDETAVIWVRDLRARAGR